jgi:hypothetical protein
MNDPYESFFNRDPVILQPISSRISNMVAEEIRPLKKAAIPNDALLEVARDIIDSKKRKRDVVLMIGAHVVRSGVQKYIIDLMENGFITCISMNGACVIHDYELALIGKTTESVSTYIKEGQFGLWQETGQINEIINRAYYENMGFGHAVGREIHLGDYPYKEYSLLACGYRLGVPITVHVGIGMDIIHTHPNFDGAATGCTSYRDFLTFVRVVQNLEDGVVMTFGSAVTAPEVFLKALALARNIAHQQGRSIYRFTSLVCDLRSMPDDLHKEPDKDNPIYFFRPLKTMLVRTVAQGGKSLYIQGNHAETIPGLWSAIQKEAEQRNDE